MGIMSRIIRLCKADLHGVMDQIEDKGLLFKQYLREMQVAMTAKRGCVDQLEEAVRKAQRHLTGYNQQVKELEEDLDRAVAGNKDDIARMLIRRRRPLRQCAANVEDQIRDLTDDLAQERERLSVQTMTYEEMRLRVAAVQARSRSDVIMMAPYCGENVPGQREPSEDEIEWELAQRKEAVASERVI